MADENIHKQEYHIRKLPTRSVTLYPNKAQVVRDIKDIELQPGSNQVTIIGLTPTTDESSIKVDGHGSATITDMTVDEVINPDRYEDVYGSDSEDEFEHDEDLNPEKAPEKPDSTSQKLKSLKSEIAKLEAERMVEQESVSNAVDSMSLLDALMRKVEKPTVNDISAGVELYASQRRLLAEKRQIASEKVDSIARKIVALRKDEILAQKAEMKGKAAAQRKLTKEVAKKRRAFEEKILAKNKLVDERCSFWPRKVYKVIVTLENSFGFTPASSRRGSMETLVKSGLTAATPEKDSDEMQKISLCLSYVTAEASWLPRYDLSIDSPSHSGSIIYRAEFKNTTSETWEDAKVILSASQTSFRGLGDPIPELAPWRIVLRKGYGGYAAVDSPQERGCRVTQHNESEGILSNYSREQLFGYGPINNAGFHTDGPKRPPVGQPKGGLFGGTLFASTTPAAAGSLFGSLGSKTQGAPGSSAALAVEGGSVTSPAPAGLSGHFYVQGETVESARGGSVGGLFGSSAAPLPPAPSTSLGAPAAPSLFGSVVSASSSAAPQQDADGSDTTDRRRASVAQSKSFGFGNTFKRAGLGATAGKAEREKEVYSPKLEDKVHGVETDSLAAPESSWEESGLTATYDLPGTRTIAPSHTSRRHKITTISLASIELNYICVPKLLPAAFLQARLTNSSSVSLRRGAAGLTLDGSFLGKGELPRVSAGETFSLALGVDPGVTVAYAKPAAKKNLKSGVFNKEDSCAFERAVTLKSTKVNGGPVEVTVKDQVPVSGDERLRVEVARPKGLRLPGDQVRAGEAAEVAEKAGSPVPRGSVYSLDGARGVVGRDEKWGKATAEMKKDGEVEWKVKLNPGHGVRLALEYEARFPASESLVSE